MKIAVMEFTGFNSPGTRIYLLPRNLSNLKNYLGKFNLSKKRRHQSRHGIVWIDGMENMSKGICSHWVHSFLKFSFILIWSILLEKMRKTTQKRRNVRVIYQHYTTAKSLHNLLSTSSFSSIMMMFFRYTSKLSYYIIIVEGRRCRARTSNESTAKCRKALYSMMAKFEFEGEII